MAFCVSVRWREGQRTGKQRVAPALVQLHRQTDGQMPCSSPVPYLTFATATSTSLGPRLCLMCGEGWKAPQPAVSTSPCGNGGDFNHCGSRVQGPLTESLAAWPGTQRSCRGSRGSLSYWWSKGRDRSLICSTRSHRLPARSLGRGRGQGGDVQRDSAVHQSRCEGLISCDPDAALSGTWGWLHGTDVEATCPGARSRPLNPVLPEPGLSLFQRLKQRSTDLNIFLIRR